MSTHGEASMLRDEVPDSPGLALERVRAFLDHHSPGLVTGPLRAELIEGGRSNLTFLISDGAARWVLRRPPLGHLLPTAHDMAREYRLLRALRPTWVPVPTALALCADPGVIGAPFYVMRFVPGATYRSDAELAVLGPRRVHAVADALVDTLVELHAVIPDDVGLADLGRPEGYLERQLRRWLGQLDASRSRELDGIDRLHQRLAGSVPTSGPAAVVHGDYRLDNVLVGDDDQIAAVLDWEMATLGDPLTDLGLLIGYVTSARHGITPGGGVGAAPGHPGADQMIHRYARASGRDLSALRWYVAFAFFKIAVVAEGIHHRFRAGLTVGDGFEHIGAAVTPLSQLGHDAFGEH